MFWRTITLSWPDMLICASIIRISIQDGHEQRGHVCTPSDRFVAFNSSKACIHTIHGCVSGEWGWTPIVQNLVHTAKQQGTPIEILANDVWHGDAPVTFCTFDSHRGLVSLREVIGWNRRLGVHSRSLQLRSLAPGPRAPHDERASETPGSL